MNENHYIFIPISLNFVPRGPIKKKTLLVQVMAWHLFGTKPLPEPMLTKIYSAMWHLLASIS